MTTYRVIGQQAVAGVQPGGTVDLDPAEVDVAALQAAGHIEPVKARAERPKARQDDTA
jgi:hypothetical protein